MQRIGSRRIWTQFLLAMFLGMSGSQAEEYSSDHRPVWSRDGRSIIFMSNRDRGDWELYRMNLDGSGLQRLTESPGWDGYAGLSPDGRRLPFDSGRNDQAPALFVGRGSGNEEGKCREAEVRGTKRCRALRTSARPSIFLARKKSTR